MLGRFLKRLIPFGAAIGLLLAPSVLTGCASSGDQFAGYETCSDGVMHKGRCPEGYRVCEHCAPGDPMQESLKASFCTVDGGEWIWAYDSTDVEESYCKK